MAVLDLSNITPNKRRLSIDLAGSLSTPKLPPDSDFFEEVELKQGQMHACYFKKNKPSDLPDDCYYDLAFLKLPRSFQYVDLNITDNDKIEFDDDPETYGNIRIDDIFTPLLLNISAISTSSLAEFHFCNNGSLEKTFKPEKAIADGCPIPLHSFDAQFIVFYYKGKLRTFQEEDPKSDDLAEREYYLTPMLLSEKNTVYYVKEKTLTNFQKILDDFSFVYKNRNNVFGIRHPLVLNDEMGIMVFREYAK